MGASLLPRSVSPSPGPPSTCLPLTTGGQSPGSQHVLGEGWVDVLILR